MYLTIVKPDNLIIIDRHSQTFNLLDFDIPGNFYALQWKNNIGHIEYNNQPNEEISKLPDWVFPIVDEYRRLKDLQDTEKEKAKHISVYFINGEERQNRIDKKQKHKQIKRQEKINRIVLEAHK